MDAVIISSNASRLLPTFAEMRRHGFHVHVEPPFRNEDKIRAYAARYRRAGDEKHGSPKKQISLSMSHLAIWRRAQLFTSNPWLYVFEDDATFQQFSLCELATMEATAPRLFFLGTCARKRYARVQSSCRRQIDFCSSLCLHAYAIRTNVSALLADAVLEWAHGRAMTGSSFYRYNLDVKLRGYLDSLPDQKKALCADMAVQKKLGSTSGHSSGW
jgi:hypothetical protein